MSLTRALAIPDAFAGALVLLVSISSAEPIAARHRAAGMPPPVQEQPRDPRPGVARPASPAEARLKASTAADPTNPRSWLELARLQEARGATAEAEATYRAAVSATNSEREVLAQFASFFTRLGQFAKAVVVLEEIATRHPADAEAHQMVATYYWDMAQKDPTVTPATRAKYVEAGLAATDRALAARADYMDAMVYKSLLLRLKAKTETDRARVAALVGEADALRTRAMALREARLAAGDSGSSSGARTPPPPPPPLPPTTMIDGQAPVRVGGNIHTPTKIHDVRPIYPQEALDARVSGMVIVEATIDPEGNVRSAKVLRSIPLLDDAALDAVKQWRFTPTLLNGVPVPVIMTVTVNFTLQ